MLWMGDYIHIKWSDVITHPFHLAKTPLKYKNGWVITIPREMDMPLFRLVVYD